MTENLIEELEEVSETFSNPSVVTDKIDEIKDKIIEINEGKLQQEQQERLKQEEQEQLEQEKLEQERLEQEQLEQEQLEQEQLEQEQLEQERLEQEQLEQEQLEQEQLEQEQLEQRENEFLESLEVPDGFTRDDILFIYQKENNENIKEILIEKQEIKEILLESNHEQLNLQKQNAEGFLYVTFAIVFSLALKAFFDQITRW